MLSSRFGLLLFFLRVRKNAHSLANYPQHNLISPATYGGESEVSVEATDQNLVGEAHPSPVLKAGVRHFSHQSPTLQLAHRGQLCHVPAEESHRKWTSLIQFKVWYVLVTAVLQYILFTL